MKAIKIIYWISTILVLAMMLYSAYGTFFIHSPEGDKVMAQIQIPMYLMKMLAVGKVLGAIAMVIPGYPRIKEWAYAGYFFDLAGATFCFIATGSPVGEWAMMAFFVVLVLVSYFTYHKLKAPKL